MVISKRNSLLATDVYKMGHIEQYVPGCNKVFSYLITRTDKNYKNVLFFGLQYYIKEYLSIKLTPEMGEEFLEYRKMILGSNSEKVETEIRKLCKLGYFPVEIKAVPEGTVLPVKNVLMTITNTDPDFHWAVGFIESLILKVWYPTTVASCCKAYREVVEEYYKQTCSEENMFLKDFTVHDFGYRGDSSEEGSALSGASHLVSFMGSDTVPALPFVKEYYNADTSNPIMLSVPASEHSVMCSFGRDNEFAAFVNMLDLYPEGIVSIVSDTFDVYKVLTEFAEKLKPRILERKGKVVFRPDSGNPETIICGNITNYENLEKAKKEYGCSISLDYPHGDRDPKIIYALDEDKYYKLEGYVYFDGKVDVVDIKHSEYYPTNEDKGAIRLLDEMFGSTLNSKGFKELNPKIGLIYGDGMYLERYIRTLEKMKDMGYASSNLVIGVGGILRNHSRDTLGFALKATHVEVDGVPRDIEKDPVTDKGKKSHKGLIKLIKENGTYITKDNCDSEELESFDNLLVTVFKDGNLEKEYSFEDIKRRAKE